MLHPFARRFKVGLPFAPARLISLPTPDEGIDFPASSKHWTAKIQRIFLHESSTEIPQSSLFLVIQLLDYSEFTAFSPITCSWLRSSTKSFIWSWGISVELPVPIQQFWREPCRFSICAKWTEWHRILLRLKVDASAGVLHDASELSFSLLASLFVSIASCFLLFRPCASCLFVSKTLGVWC